MRSQKNIKTIVVECKMRSESEVKEYQIDSTIFDDVYMEAATRFVEQHVKQPNAKMPPILYTYDKKHAKNVNKHTCYNSYYVMINAGFHDKAEILRENFLSLTGKDLKKDDIRGKMVN